MARTIAVVAVIAGSVLVVLTLFGNGDGYRYKMLFQTGGQLVPGNQVMVAGQPVGTIDSIELTDDAQAEVDVKLDRPLLEGTTAQIRLTSLSGIANRYIALHMGPDPDAELPDGATLAADDDDLARRPRPALQHVRRADARVASGLHPGPGHGLHGQHGGGAQDVQVLRPEPPGGRAAALRPQLRPAGADPVPGGGRARLRGGRGASRRPGGPHAERERGAGRGRRRERRRSTRRSAPCRRRCARRTRRS